MKFETLLEEGLAKISEILVSLGGRVLVTILTLFVGYWLIKWVCRLVKKTFHKLEVEEGTAGFLAAIIKVALYIVLGFMIAATFGVDAASIVAVLGSAGVAIGLAIQGSLSNFAGGILIILLKPFKVGDYIIEDNKGNAGTVTEISLFYTRLQTTDDRTVILPNGTLANTSLTNVSKTPNRMLELKFNVSYDSDWKGAIGIIGAAFEEDEAKLPDFESEAYLDNLADNAITLGGRCYVKNEDYRDAKIRITEKIFTRFTEEGIDTPQSKVVLVDGH